MQISMHLLRIVSVLVASELFHLVCGGISAEETLSESDADFCHGGLSLMYPGLAVDRCLVVPRERSLRERLSSKWGAPQVRWEHAEKEKRYTLMMVDPDTPSRCNPTKSHWRHWLVVDIVGSDLRKGDVKGSVLSGYRRPTPPRGTGLHRYQFMLFEQQGSGPLSLSCEEASSLGTWDPQAFVKRFRLGRPLAALQFLTRNAAE
ncbi:phosphatidylethanolamine-binding protein 4 [Paramormyrops kingsleyae]|uniref:Phosphatidylethanolamine binding protein 4 n=1 Tax=Paramormyrops kingsleyae TaxID=1676925 RepID=A0A3B3S4R7_9TELE|nr:phosphatidylethanolamine-binding protein 4 [Paramormyrops kingsleyae]